VKADTHGVHAERIGRSGEVGAVVGVERQVLVLTQHRAETTDRPHTNSARIARRLGHLFCGMPPLDSKRKGAQRGLVWAPFVLLSISSVFTDGIEKRREEKTVTHFQFCAQSHLLTNSAGRSISVTVTGDYIQGGPKMAQILYALTSSNIDRFQTYFTLSISACFTYASH